MKMDCSTTEELYVSKVPSWKLSYNNETPIYLGAASGYNYIGTRDSLLYSNQTTTGTDIYSSWKLTECEATSSWAETTTLTGYSSVITSGYSTLRIGQAPVWKTYYDGHVLSPEERMRAIIKSRQAPLVIATRLSLQSPGDIRETRARETLHRVIGDANYRNFVKNGFVSVRAASGIVYQIFPGHKLTNAFKDGQCIHRLCVVLSGDFTPTDHLIMRYLLLLNDEAKFIATANKSNPIMKSEMISKPSLSLVDIYKDLKKVA